MILPFLDLLIADSFNNKWKFLSRQPEKKAIEAGRRVKLWMPRERGEAKYQRWKKSTSVKAYLLLHCYNRKAGQVSGLSYTSFPYVFQYKTS